MRALRYAGVALVFAYMFIAGWSGNALHQTIPAVSLAGAAYFGSTWPLWLKISPIHPPIPAWCFSFRSDI